MHPRFHAHFDDADKGGGGGTATQPKPAPTSASLADRLTAEHGTERRALEVVAKDNWKARERARAAEARVKELEAKLPADGAVVLVGDDAKAWEAFKGLNLKPGDVEAAVKERDTLKETLAARDRDAVLRDAAESLGWKPAVLTKLAATEGLHVEMKEAEVEEKNPTTGKVEKVKKPVPHVRPAADEKAALEPLATFAESKLADFLPALRADAARGGGTAGQAASGVPYPAQAGTGKPAGSTYDPVAAGKALAEQQKRAAAQKDLAYK